MTGDVDVIVEALLPDEARPESIEALIGHVLEREGAEGAWSIAVVLTTDERLRELHSRFMSDDSVTDVMTFPSDGLHGEPGGDIVISVERAAAQAPEWGLSTWDEVRFLIAHGALHLCGWDDETEEKRTAMLERQRILLDEFDLLDG